MIALTTGHLNRPKSVIKTLKTDINISKTVNQLTGFVKSEQWNLDLTKSPGIREIGSL